jgi:hypothetical protein
METVAVKSTGSGWMPTMAASLSRSTTSEAPVSTMKSRRRPSILASARKWPCRSL